MQARASMHEQDTSDILVKQVRSRQNMSARKTCKRITQHNHTPDRLALALCRRSVDSGGCNYFLLPLFDQVKERLPRGAGPAAGLVRRVAQPLQHHR